MDITNPAISECNISIQSLLPETYGSKVAALDMLRLDQLHPVISGNKWYKLKYNLQAVIEGGHKSIITFGGAYSNHLIATAAAAVQYNLPSVGIIRGEDAERNPSDTLNACRELGMELIYIAREEYARKDDPAWLQELSSKQGNAYIISEGGANPQGRKGAEEIAALIPLHYTHICTAVGSGTTFIGLRNALPDQQKLIGFAPIKGGNYLTSYIDAHLHEGENAEWRLTDQYHFRGFGKFDDELIRFMNSFYEHQSIPLDIVYTSKMMYGVFDLIQQDIFPSEARILCIHTGGLQGNNALSRSGRLIY